MEALVIHAAGDLRVEDVPTPEVGAEQLLVRVSLAGDESVAELRMR
jgi:L-idonate 5-dehydrogenase